MKKLSIALPNGSLWPKVEALFRHRYFPIFSVGRTLQLEIKGGLFGKNAWQFRPMAIPSLVSDGKFDVGITGLDCLHETGKKEEVEEIMRFPFNRGSGNPIRIVLIGTRKSQVKWSALSSESDTVMVIKSEYPGITQRWLGRDPNIVIEPSDGTTESLVATGSYPFGVVATETGASIRANNLCVIEELLRNVYPVLIASKEAMADRWKKEAIQYLRLVFQSYFNAHSDVAIGGNVPTLVELKMNVPQDCLPSLLRVLPAQLSPTITNLSNPKFKEVSVVVETKRIHQVLKRALKNGAQDLNEHAVSACFPRWE